MLVVQWGSVSAELPITIWDKRFDGPATPGANDTSYQAVRDSHQNIIVVAASGDFYGNKGDVLIFKYSSVDGSTLWSQQHKAPADLGETLPSVALNQTGDVFVTAEVETPDSGTDFYTAKYAASDGKLLWARLHGGPGNARDRPTIPAVDSEGNIYVAGLSIFAGDVDIMIVKHSGQDGAVLWEQRFGIIGGDYVRSITVDKDNHLLLTGVTFLGLYTAKVNSADGALLWERGYQHSEGHTYGAWGIATDESGDVIVTGTAYFDFNNHIYTAKYAGTNGALVWEKIYSDLPGEGSGVATLILAENGDVIIGGTSGKDLLVAKYSSTDGELLWERRIAGSPGLRNAVSSAAVDSAGNILVVGDVKSESYAAKLTGTEGKTIWEAAGRFDFSIRSVIVDEDDNAVFAGQRSLDAYTAMYSGENGALVWQTQYDGPKRSNDRADATEIDRNGNVFVLGYSGGPRLVKYGGEGAIAWERAIAATGTGLALDPLGDVVVFGTLQTNNSSRSADIYTAKFANRDGTLIWENRFDGIDHLEDRATDLKINAVGDVFITGFTRGSAGYDIYSAKYRGSDGQIVWERHYGGPENVDDLPSSLSLDLSGNPLIAGSSGDHLLVAKYSSLAGTLMWRQRHRWETNRAYAGAITVDRGGTIGIVGSSGRDLVIARLNGNDGAFLWDQRMHPPAPRDTAYASRIVADGEGNLVVSAGYTDTQKFDEGNVYVAKYAALDGALMFEERFARIDFDEPRALAVDTAGNVFVGITSARVLISRFKTHVFKYAIDGRESWQMEFDGLSAADMALDNEGRIVLTGTDNSDFRTLYFQDEVEPRLSASINIHGQLAVWWPAILTGWRLEMQQRDHGISSAGLWSAVAGSMMTNNLSMPVDGAAQSLFLRLVQP